MVVFRVILSGSGTVRRENFLLPASPTLVARPFGVFSTLGTYLPTPPPPWLTRSTPCDDIHTHG